MLYLFVLFFWCFTDVFLVCANFVFGVLLVCANSLVAKRGFGQRLSRAVPALKEFSPNRFSNFSLDLQF